MASGPDSDLGRALEILEQIWLQGPPLPDTLPGPAAAQERLSHLLQEIVMVQHLALTLSCGDVSQNAKGKGLTLGCLKSLQANLRHLTWQTQMIAGGDFSQNVDFMGEFAEAFNHMVRSLEDARARLQRRELELSQSNRALEAQIFERRQAEEEVRKANEHLKLRLAEIERLQTKLHEQAIRDPLTNLFNRRYLRETLDRELAQAERAGLPLPVILMDIDYFKRLNDEFGHKAGDLMLTRVAELLQRFSRRSDIACRYGGEEFVVVLPGASLPDAVARGDELRSLVEAARVAHNDLLLQTTISLGVAVFPEHGKTSDELLQAADGALYAAKTAGRNCLRAAGATQG